MSKKHYPVNLYGVGFTASLIANSLEHYWRKYNLKEMAYEVFSLLQQILFDEVISFREINGEKAFWLFFSDGKKLLLICEDDFWTWEWF